MFNFIKEKKQKKIVFYPNEEASLSYPPEPVKFNLPEWYKDLSPYLPNAAPSAMNPVRMNNKSILTCKRCIPMMDYMTSGYILKSQTDILLSTQVDGENLKFFGMTPDPSVSHALGMHGYEQCPVKINDRKNLYIKFFCNWTIKTPPGYSTFFYQHHYFFEDRFTLFPAIVDTDTYDGTTGFIGTMNEKYKDSLVAAGTPLVVAFPFKRDDWEMELSDQILHYNDQNITKKMRRHFDNVYRNFFHFKKKYD